MTNRPAGVTASAIVAILGSVLTFFFAVTMIAAAFVETPQPQPPGYAGFAVGSAIVLIGLALLGLFTAVGLLQLRAWARTSILVFAGFLAVMSLLMLVGVSIMQLPAPPGTDPAAAGAMRAMMLVMFAVPLGVAIWWLVQFNRPSIVAAFASDASARGASRPLAISIIAWVNIVGGASCIVPILARAPAFLVGVTFTGWAAGVVYAFFGAVSLYIGRGLLDLRERARRLAIAWFGLSMLHAGMVTLIPPLRERMLRAQLTVQDPQAPASPFDETALAMIALTLLALISIAAIWLLVRHRAAFTVEEKTSAS